MIGSELDFSQNRIRGQASRQLTLGSDMNLECSQTCRSLIDLQQKCVEGHALHRGLPKVHKIYFEVQTG
jgi:hypothetical protein